MIFRKRPRALPLAYWLVEPVYVGEESAHATFGPTQAPRRRGLRGLLSRRRG